MTSDIQLEPHLSSTQPLHARLSVHPHGTLVLCDESLDQSNFMVWYKHPTDFCSFDKIYQPNRLRVVTEDGKTHIAISDAHFTLSFKDHSLEITGI